MSLYDMIMGRAQEFCKADWAALGKGEIEDEELIAAMLAQGYEGLED